MIDYQRVIEYLRDFRLQANKQATDDVRHYATEYAELCKQANDRLRQCSQFLGQGLRSEAIHLADEAPNLLDLVAALDLPEPDAWAEFCQQADLPVPLPLQMDRAAQLNEAYAQDQPLEHLLNRHRLLALSRAPVAERLDVLRQIATQDPGGALWEKSIRTFEKARLRELPAAFLAAVKNKDPNAITALHQEINQPWLEPVPADIQSGVSDAYGRLQRMSVEAALRELVRPLREAFAARSYGECASLVKKWQDIIAEGNATTIAVELNQEIEPVRSWLKEEDDLRARHKAFTNACRSFGNLLDADATSTELESAHGKLKEFDEVIPEAIEARYQEVIARRVAAASHRHRMQLAMIGGAVLLILAILAAGYFVISRGNLAKGWTQKIDAAVAKHDYYGAQEAKGLLEDQVKQAPGLESDPALADARKQAKQLVADAETDAKDLSTFLAQLADGKTKADAAAKLDQPEQLLAALADANGTLEHTKRDLSLIEKSDMEKLDTARKELQSVQQDLAAKVSRTVKVSVDALGGQIDALASQDDATAGKTLRDLADKAHAIQALGNLDKDTQTAVAALLERITQQQTSLEQRVAESDALQNIRLQAISADNLKKALQDFMGRFPTSARKADFTVALDRTPFDKSIEAWHSLTAGWDKHLVATTADAAQKRVDVLQNYIATYPGSPLLAAANAYVDYLKRAGDALTEKGAWQTAFGDMLNNPLVKDLAYVQTSDGRRFYVLGDIKREDHRFNDQVTTSFLAVDPKDPSKRITIRIEPPIKLVTATPIPLPHTIFAADMAEKLKFIDDTNWETFGIDRIDTLIKADNMDPVVRAALIEQAVKTTDAVDGWALEGVYTRVLADLSRLQIGSLVWIDRDHPVSELTLASIRHVFEAMPKADAVKQQLASRKAEIFKAISYNYVSTGVLLRDAQGNPTVETAEASAGTIGWAISPIPAGAAIAPPAPAAHAAPAAPAAPTPPAPAAPETPATAPAEAPTAPAAGDTTPPPPVTGDTTPPPPVTGGTDAAATPAPPTPTPAATATPAAPTATALTPAVTTTLVQVAEFKDGKFVVNKDAVRDLPQGTLIYLTKP